MAEPNLQASSTSALDFIDNSTLTCFIPIATDFKPQETLTALLRTVGASLESIESRDSLFFDESVDVYLALRTPHEGEEALRSSLKRLVVSLEAQIVNSNAPDRDGPAASEVIFSGTGEDTDDPIVITDENNGNHGEDDQHIYVFWKIPVFLTRPRIRLQGPSVIFTASASLKPLELSLTSGPRDGYLPSGIASGLNLLESFGSDPALHGIQPRLSALRVSRVAPLTHNARDLLLPIKTSPKQISLHIYPAVHSRIRFARPMTTPANPAIIAMLEVDFTPYFDCEISLTSIKMSVPDSIVEDLTSQAAMALPMSCVAHDHITFLYSITPEEPDALSKNPIRELNIAISATALEQPGVCTPKLTMAWTTTVDFTLPVNPGYGSAMQPIQRSHRPSQLSINNTTSFIAPAVARPDALPSLEAATNKSEATIPDLGITMTFTAPPPTQKIYPGDIFVWTVFVVNRSQVTAATPPRKLALLAIPKRRRNESRVTRPPSMSHPPVTSHGPSRPKTSRDLVVADAVIDETMVHAMQRSSVVDSAEMVCLSADVRIGPLATGACHVVELRFMALKSGIVGIEAVRVVDLGTTEHVDIRELPTVVVEEAEVERNGIAVRADTLVTASA